MTDSTTLTTAARRSSAVVAVLLCGVWLLPEVQLACLALLGVSPFDVTNKGVLPLLWAWVFGVALERRLSLLGRAAACLFQGLFVLAVLEEVLRVVRMRAFSVKWALHGETWLTPREGWIVVVLLVASLPAFLLNAVTCRAQARDGRG
jgi:hypothetical protein